MTDIFCCIVFVLYILLMLAIGAYALKEGDPFRIITPFDSDGNICGKADQGGRDFSEYPYKCLTNPEMIIAGAAD